MNETLNVIHNRRSVRRYADRPIERETTDQIIQTAMRAPTAGNMMLYSILEVESQEIKDKLVKSCDNQPFIATAPLVLLFLADYQRWFDIFIASDVPGFCQAEGLEFRYPGEGDLMLACSDALIAAQTAVIAAESMGIGSCYIGDIMENHEFHRDLFGLPQYVFPVGMVCFGYPKIASPSAELPPRFPQKFIHSKDRYQPLDPAAIDEFFAGREPAGYIGNAENIGQHHYARKFSADFSVEMTRSVKAAIDSWTTHK